MDSEEDEMPSKEKDKDSEEIDEPPEVRASHSFI